MEIKLNLNPDEALALIQILERDILFPDVSVPVILEVEKARHEWANEKRANHSQQPSDYVIESDIGFIHRENGE